MHAGLEAETLLTLWECGQRAPAGARGEALLRASFVGAATVLTVGERNARLIELHARLFGRVIELLSRCPACGTAVQFSSDCETLAAQARPALADSSPHRLEASGYQIEFRLPDSADVAGASSAEDEEDFARRLLDRCVLACTHEGNHVPVRQLPMAALDALSRHMELLDPGASVSFALDCPQCAMRWQAPLDLGQMVWQKVRAAAERLLLDVDVLARAYGWTEREVLSLNPLRRAAYLQMVTA